jgi:hypothetical protein
MIFIILINTQCFGEQPVHIRKIFYDGYKKWISYIQKPEMEGSSGTNYYNEGMPDIIALGLPVVPIILETMHWYAENETDSYVFHLQYALHQITKVNFNSSLQGNVRGLSKKYNTDWEMWYRNSEKYTKNEFEINMAAWRGSKHEESSDLRKEVIQRITNIGILVLPYLIKEIQNGEIELIPIVSTLSNGEVVFNVTVEQCTLWWEKNQKRFKKQSEQVHFDTFRNWSSIEKHQNPAKFISAIKNEIKLEAIDGTFMIIDISKLSQKDQKYIKRQLTTEKN